MPDIPEELPAGFDPLDLRPWLNKLRALVLAGGVTADSAGGLTSIKGRYGTTIGRVEAPEWWGRITYHGTGNAYSWVEVYPATGGGWSTGTAIGYATGDPARGTVPADPALEVNGNSTLALGTIHRLSRDRAVGRVNFRAPTCAS